MTKQCMAVITKRLEYDEYDRCSLNCGCMGWIENSTLRNNHGYPLGRGQLERRSLKGKPEECSSYADHGRWLEYPAGIGENKAVRT